MKQVDWSDIYKQDSVDLAYYNILEEKILEILNSMAPMRKTQVRKKRSDWISPYTKDLMKQRDAARTLAVESKLSEDWSKL